MANLEFKWFELKSYEWWSGVRTGRVVWFDGSHGISEHSDEKSCIFTILGLRLKWDQNLKFQKIQKERTSWHFGNTYAQSWSLSHENWGCYHGTTRSFGVNCRNSKKHQRRTDFSVPCTPKYYNIPLYSTTYLLPTKPATLPMTYANVFFPSALRI